MNMAVADSSAAENRIRFDSPQSQFASHSSRKLSPENKPRLGSDYEQVREASESGSRKSENRRNRPNGHAFSLQTEHVATESVPQPTGESPSIKDKPVETGGMTAEADEQSLSPATWQGVGLQNEAARLALLQMGNSADTNETPTQQQSVTVEPAVETDPQVEMTEKDAALSLRLKTNPNRHTDLDASNPTKSPGVPGTIPSMSSLLRSESRIPTHESKAQASSQQAETVLASTVGQTSQLAIDNTTGIASQDTSAGKPLLELATPTSSIAPRSGPADGPAVSRQLESIHRLHDWQSARLAKTPLRELTWRADAQGDKGVQVRMIAANGDVNVNVHTLDRPLSERLQTNASELLSSLRKNGYEAEIHSPQTSSEAREPEQQHSGQSGQQQQSSQHQAKSNNAQREIVWRRSWEQQQQSLDSDTEV